MGAKAGAPVLDDLCQNGLLVDGVLRGKLGGWRPAGASTRRSRT